MPDMSREKVAIAVRLGHSSGPDARTPHFSAVKRSDRWIHRHIAERYRLDFGGISVHRQDLVGRGKPDERGNGDVHEGSVPSPHPRRVVDVKMSAKMQRDACRDE